MNKIYVHLDFGAKAYRVGELYASSEMGRHVFSYDPEFISSGLQISPLTMPLSTKTFVAPRNPDLYDLHSVFADSLPDAWGKKVQDAEFGKIGIVEATALQRLAFVGRHGIGALRYHPAQEFEQGEDLVELADLRKATQYIIEGSVDEVSEELLKSGGSAGGARPKFLLDMHETETNIMRYSRIAPGKGFIPIVLKVPVGGEDHYQRIEYVYSCIAKKAGLDIPDCFLIVGEKSNLAHFAIRRFDMLANGDRLHVHTLAGIMGINFRETTPDCRTFLCTIDDVTLNHTQVVEGFRRIVFNFIGSNKDDHAKNFSFIMSAKGEWSLAPAYDVGFSKGRNDLHLMRLNDKFRNAELRDFQMIARDFDVAQWEEILGKTLSAFATWPDVAKESAVPEKYIQMIDNKIKENTKRLEKGLGRRREV
jgi:serine/threonine-protein kinase HipA